jgi:lipopolysaccharide export system protein LptA
MRRRAPRDLAAAVLCLCLTLIPALARATERLDIRGDFSDTVIAKGKEHAVWTGSVLLEAEDSTIRADRIDLWGKNFVYAECRGNLSVLNHKKDTYLTCDTISYNRDTKFLVGLGNVYMEDHKNGIVVKADTLQYDDQRDEVIVQIRVRIFGDKDNLECRAEFARYLREDEILVLSGMPWVLWKGDEYRAAQITVTLDNGEVQAVKMIEGSGKIRSEEETKTEAAPAAQGAAPASLAPQGGSGGGPTESPQPGGVTPQ